MLVLTTWTRCRKFSAYSAYAKPNVNVLQTKPKPRSRPIFSLATGLDGGGGQGSSLTS